jgi:hypothetical protein
LETKMKDAYTSQEIANILERPVQSITRAARREGWQALPREGRGGGNCWIVASMPERTRLAIAARACPAACSTVNAPSSPASPVSPLTLQGAAKTRAHARAAVVLAARVFTAASKMARTRALDEFVVRYNAGEIAVEPDVRAALPSLCRNSLINWERRAQNQGMASLAGNFGQHRKGAGIIDSQPQVRELVLGLIAEYATLLESYYNVSSAGVLDLPELKGLVLVMREYGFKPTKGSAKRKATRKKTIPATLQSGADDPLDRKPLMEKIEAQLTEKGRVEGTHVPWGYAVAVLKKQSGGVTRCFEHATAEQLRGVIAALTRDAKRKGRRAY